VRDRKLSFDLGTLPGGVPYEVWPDATGSKAVVYDCEHNPIAEIDGLGRTASQKRTNMLALAKLIEAATRSEELPPPPPPKREKKGKTWW
jgi:hypothetical protein